MNWPPGGRIEISGFAELIPAAPGRGLLVHYGHPPRVDQSYLLGISATPGRTIRPL